MLENAKTRKVATFIVKYLQYLDSNHQLIQALPEFATDDNLLTLYRSMALTRALDNKAINLQRTGQMGTYPASIGQEAVGVGVGNAMYADDVFCTYYRDQGVLLQRGVDASEILLYWGGDERGSAFQNDSEDLPVCVPIAGQCLHATGVAFAMQYRQQARAVVTTLGEGGTSKGDFYEAINLAGAWRLPLVFVVNNNQWAISVPRHQQTATLTIAQKAIAAGFQGIQVDGNDVIAVREATRAAIDKARQGGGPTLIEAITFRLCDHTTADDASRYMPAEERKHAWQIEPIARLGYYLEAQGLWSRDHEAKLQQELQATIDTAVKKYLATPPQQPEACFDYLYAELPDALLDQRDQIGEDR